MLVGNGWPKALRIFGGFWFVHGGEKLNSIVFLVMEREISHEVKSYAFLGHSVYIPSCLLNPEVEVFIEAYGPRFRGLLRVGNTPL